VRNSSGAENAKENKAQAKCGLRPVQSSQRKTMLTKKVHEKKKKAHKKGSRKVRTSSGAKNVKFS
jgi:hypothetical protein